MSLSIAHTFVPEVLSSSAVGLEPLLVQVRPAGHAVGFTESVSEPVPERPVKSLITHTLQLADSPEYIKWAQDPSQTRVETAWFSQSLYVLDQDLMLEVWPDLDLQLNTTPNPSYPDLAWVYECGIAKQSVL